MKAKAMGALLAMCVSNASKADTYEIVTMKFKTDATYQEQENAMLKLNEIASQFDGFKSRDFFYSTETGYWVDMLVWDNEIKAKDASESIMKNEIAGRVFSMIDESTVIFSHFNRIGGIHP